MPMSRPCAGRGCGLQPRSENRRCSRNGTVDDFCGSHSGERTRLGHTTELRLLRRRRNIRVPCRDVSDAGLWQSFRTERSTRWIKSSHSTVGASLRLPSGLVPHDLPGGLAVDYALPLATQFRCAYSRCPNLLPYARIAFASAAELSRYSAALSRAFCRLSTDLFCPAAQALDGPHHIQYTLGRHQ